MFKVGEVFPPVEHQERINRYKRNKQLFKGNHFEVFDKYNSNNKELLYIAMNLASIICKKSADFLFGEPFRALADKHEVQEAFERFINDNDLHITNYETALANAYRGDAFYKVRYGQTYGGKFSTELDPPHVIIEAQNAEYVFPEVDPANVKNIIAFHIAVPVKDGKKWFLKVESHYAGEIIYRTLVIKPHETNRDGTIKSFLIQGEIVEDAQSVTTGVPMPLVVHIPNFTTDEDWQGIDDLSELTPIFDEINNRLTQIANILDKHADPALAVPAGTIGEDEFGNPVFNIAVNKVFEIDGQEDAKPQYITWNGQIYEAFQELDRLTEMAFTIAEIPSVVLGKGDSGTSGSSGLAIRWRMNSLLAKINRKRQYYERGLKQVLLVAQMLEIVTETANYELTKPQLVFQDGLPKDELEVANIMAIRTGNKQSMSMKSLLMRFENMTEAEAEAELERIEKDKEEAQKALLELKEKQEPTDDEDDKEPVNDDKEKDDKGGNE
jgi:SPP1 family phage portal protein